MIRAIGETTESNSSNPVAEPSGIAGPDLDNGMVL